MRRLVAAGLLIAALALPALAEQPAPVAQASRGGALWLRPNADLFERLGVRVEGALPKPGPWEMPLLPKRVVRVELGDAAPTRLIDGELGVPALRLRRSDGARSPALRLVPEPRSRLGWKFVDATGRVWLRITHGMRSPDRVADGLRLITADLRVGPALAAWTRPSANGRVLANAELHLPLDPMSAKAEAAIAKSCAVPNFPGTPGFVADIQLIDMVNEFYVGGVNVQRCRRSDATGTCDGPGADDGEVVIVPSARLKNRTSEDAADIPWHTKFSGIFAPYGNDQHPFLIWNLYRLDAEGHLEQIARSGLKHAFATANDFCQDATCPRNGQILGRACEDIYNAASNDSGFFLSPRSELIPARGIWGRCGSVFDDTDNNPGDGLPGCDAVSDSPADNGYRERLVARENDIDATLNPGAQYWIDAWYLMRDDVDIYNSMGSRTLAPEYDDGFWNPGPLGAFRQGPVIDRWLESAPAGGLQQRGELASNEGHVVVAARVVALPNDRWQYDYAVMNFDFARAVTDPNTAEPNLRVTSNLGLSALELALPNGAAPESSVFRDGDDAPTDDWPATPTIGALRWAAPSGGTLDWGRLVFLRVISTAAPALGEMRLEVAQPGDPSFYAVTTLVPDGASIFRSGFE